MGSDKLTVPVSGPGEPDGDGSCAGTGDGPVTVPADFTPMPDRLPPWIDIKAVCEEAKRFVALHALTTFNAVAINDGRRVFTTADLGGEFRRLFVRAAGDVPRIDPNDAAIVYDCAAGRQWVAPRPSAIRFLGEQF